MAKTEFQPFAMYDIIAMIVLGRAVEFSLVIYCVGSNMCGLSPDCKGLCQTQTPAPGRRVPVKRK